MASRTRGVPAVDPQALAAFQAGLRKRYTDAQILDELKSCASRLGRSPSMREFAADPETTVHPQTVIEHFGSWNAAKREAGLVPRRFATRGELVRLLKGIPAKINLIPFNPWPGTKYECSDWERIERFSEIVFKAGYASPVRTPRGRDILAACGQLKSETEKLRARARLMLESGIGAEGVYALGDAD